MKTNIVNQDLNCPGCHTGGKKQLFKVSGQSTPKCADCLGKYCETVGPSKTVVLDGIHHASGNDAAVEAAPPEAY